MDSLNNPNEKIRVKGIVEKITYKNEKNGYTVAILNVGKEKLTAVGTFPFISEGESVTFYGEYIVHPTYGTQLSVTDFERNVPATSASVLRYLSSGVIKGIGPSTATKIVEKFGSETLDILQNNPIELSVIRGISEEKALKIGEEYMRQYGIKDIMIMLAPYNFSPERCVKIYRVLGKDSVKIIKENPYVMCDDKINISFEIAEKIAFDFGVSANLFERLASGILYIIKSNLQNGHTCLPREKVLNIAVNLLESDYEHLSTICDTLIDKMMLFEKTVGDISYIALPKYYNSEEYIAARLYALSNDFSYEIPVSELEIDYVENKLGFKFETLQREAVKSAFKSNFLILTGGPGTGKTTTLNAIIELFEQRKLKIILAAPTGRAAKRMTELTGRDSKTIHRLLEVEWDSEDRQSFSRNEKNPLECDVIIVDESSMLDCLLFESLLRALKLNCKIVLVGDTDQLPSISAGNVLNDIISSEKFNTVCLKKVFRQSKESSIITNAHAIINGEEIDISNKGKDFFMLRNYNANEVSNTLLELVSDRLVSAYNFDSIKDIQVICPSRKGSTGTANLNNLLQSCLNPQGKKPQVSYKGVYFRQGDKVMQTKNNYDIEWQKDNGEKGFGIFNGDVGLIEKIDRQTGSLSIRFDDRVAVYLFEEMEQIELAYAITVHKSQGSEFDCVVVPLFEVPAPLCFCNLLYTAVTRSKKLLVIVGDERVLYNMANNNKKTLRYTLLREFIDKHGDF